MRVLIVEDESHLAKAIRDGLRSVAIAADIAGDADTAPELPNVDTHDIDVLDLDIPDPSGDEKRADDTAPGARASRSRP